MSLGGRPSAATPFLSREERRKQSNVVSFDRQQKTQQPDIIDELTHNREEYMGDKWLTIYNMPSYLVSSTDRLRSKVGGRRPGMSPTLCCLVYYGINEVSEYNEIKQIQDIKRNLTEIEGDGRYIEIASNLIGHIRIGFSADTGSKRMNVALTGMIKDDLNELSQETGVENQVLATMCVVAGLNFHREDLLKKWREDIERQIDVFKTTCRMYVEASHAIVKVVERESKQ